jgi:exopolysaccharide biosynthesis polyprenyl glycosylphosphotransferase
VTVEALTLAGDRSAYRSRLERGAKRLIDVVAALALVVALAPVLLVLGALVRATSRGPALYRQVRVGQDGREITVLKFRSMRVDAEQQLARLRAFNEATGPLFKIRHDPRVTSVGRWMRRFSLDELPQLINVLGGSMSLVGPRPALPHEAARFDAEARRRHAVKPGLTGLWQISGRSDLEWADAVRLDLHYVEHWSIGLDLVILVRTIPAVLSGRGAY